jgi:WhiB family redox-sensing transcriptional regulator
VALSPVRSLSDSPLPASSDAGLTVEHDDDWRAVASCRDTDPDLFFPVGTTGPAIDQIEAAKAVCRECDAKAPCLDFALTTNQDSGIWGGTSEEERRKLRRQWLAAKRRAS